MGFLGRSVVCIASGPSLTAEDCALVERSGLPSVVVNTSWRIARFADVLLAGDGAWWDANAAEVDIHAHRVCCGQAAARRHGVEFFKPLQAHWNSGMAAIWYAQARGAGQVILLGYDCRVVDGRRHWHPDHEKTKNPPESMVRGWARNFAQMPCSGPVMNASRDTTITRWPRVSLEHALSQEAIAA